MIEFTIPGRPKAWQRAVPFVDKRTGRMIKATPKDMQAAQKDVATLCRFAMRTAKPMTGAVRLELLFVYAIPPSWPAWKKAAAKEGKVWKTSRPDVDNLVKLVMDALNDIAWRDDCQIVRLSPGKRYGSPERTEVRITELDVLCDHSSRDAFRAEQADREGQASLALDPVKACDTQTEGGSPRGRLA